MGASQIEKYLQSRRNLAFIALKTSTTCLRLVLETVSLFFSRYKGSKNSKENSWKYYEMSSNLQKGPTKWQIAQKISWNSWKRTMLLEFPEMF